MDRRVFFDRVRQSVFRGRLQQGQVDGMNAVLDAWDESGFEDRRWLAYMLATDYHETAHTMQPIKERGGRSYFMRMYDKTGNRPHVARRLGNTQVGDGAKFAGRGYVQLTGRSNYRKASKVVDVDLLADPDMAMDPHVAAKVMFHGMVNGWFTGKKLSHYFKDDRTDWISARRIINGTDRASLIAGYARKFYAAILRADEPLKSPEAVGRSRTVHASMGLMGGGAAKTGFDAYEFVNLYEQGDGYISRGDLFGMAVGAVVIGVGVYVAYCRWDDAGRPSIRKIIRGAG